MDELAWIRDEPARFLDKSIDMGVKGDRVCLASYPRSGNTFLKKFIERITGLTTGGEIRSDILLTMVGMMGEGHCSTDDVWITKSHSPLQCKLNKDDDNVLTA